MTALTVDVTNVGGIEDATFTLEDPVTLVTGPNATNKTSLLGAIAFALGRDDVSLRSGTDHAEVTLSIGERTVTRTATRSGRGVEFGGEAWIADREERPLYEHFGCLLEFNPLRSAVRQNEDIEPVLKEPVDIERLEQLQSTKIDEKRRLKRDVERLDGVEADIRDERQRLDQKRDERAELEAELERLQEQQAETSETSEELEALREKRADLVVSLEDLERQIDDIEAAISGLESDREEVEERLAEKQSVAEEYDVSELKSERQSLQEDIEEIAQRQEILQSVVTTNREILNSDYAGVFGRESELLDDTVSCWVCGQSASVADIEDNIEELQDLIEQDKRRQREYEPRLEDIEEQIAEAKSVRREVAQLESELSDIERQLEDRRDSLETKRNRARSVRAELESIDEDLAATEAKQTEEITDLTDQIESVQVDLQTTEQAIDQAQDRLDSLEENRRERAEKTERIDELTADIADLTERIENLEHHLREEFNEAMDDLVTELAFERIERVRLDGEFTLVVAREIDGTVRQDTVASLSESEREVVGLVLALAGYVAYDLDDVTPVLLLDTLGALDTDRGRRLLEYFGGTADFLVAAVLPETARQLGFETVVPSEQTRLSEPHN